MSYLTNRDFHHLSLLLEKLNLSDDLKKQTFHYVDEMKHADNERDLLIFNAQFFGYIDCLFFSKFISQEVHTTLEDIGTGLYEYYLNNINTKRSQYKTT